MACFACLASLARLARLAAGYAEVLRARSREGEAVAQLRVAPVRVLGPTGRSLADKLDPSPVLPRVRSLDKLAVGGQKITATSPPVSIHDLGLRECPNT